MSRHKKDCLCDKCNKKFMLNQEKIEKEIDELMKGVLEDDDFKDFKNAMKEAKLEQSRRTKLLKLKKVRKNGKI